MEIQRLADGFRNFTLRFNNLSNNKRFGETHPNFLSHGHLIDISRKQKRNFFYRFWGHKTQFNTIENINYRLTLK